MFKTFEANLLSDFILLLLQAEATGPSLKSPVSTRVAKLLSDR